MTAVGGAQQSRDRRPVVDQGGAIPLGVRARAMLLPLPVPGGGVAALDVPLGLAVLVAVFV